MTPAEMQPTSPSDAREAARQRAIVAALHGDAWEASAAGFAEAGARLDAGLRAYRSNLGATAERALGSTFATVRAALGAEAFAALARRFHDAAPPARGDLGEWGGGFADWLARQPQTNDLPGLPDVARLDLAAHRCERAADAVVDVGSLDALQRCEPSGLRLQLAPGTALLRTAHPVTIAHRLAQAAVRDGTGLDASTRRAVQAALAGAGAECVRVARVGWRATVEAVDAPTFALTESLLDGADLATALTRAGASFDFAAWLVEALRSGWVQAVRADVNADGDADADADR